MQRSTKCRNRPIGFGALIGLKFGARKELPKFYASNEMFEETIDPDLNKVSLEIAQSDGCAWIVEMSPLEHQVSPKVTLI